MTDALADGASPETLREIHQDELRQLRTHLFATALVTALIAAAWGTWQFVYHGGSSALPIGLLVVDGLFRTARAAQRWWTARQLDPVAGAPEAEAARDRAAAEAAARAARFARRPAYATRTIAAALIAIAVLEFLAVGSVSRALAVAGLDKARVAAGESWRLLTAAFLHGSALHLWTNVGALVVFGSIVEAYSTRSRLLLAFLAAVVVGNLASLWLLPHAPSLGASGGILGLVGFVYALSRRRPNDLPTLYQRAAMTTMILTALVGAVGFQFIDSAAHAGGALTGFLIGWLTVPRELPRGEQSASRYEDDRIVSTIGALTAGVLAAAAIYAGMKVFAERPRPVTSLHADVIQRNDGGFDLVLENVNDVPLEAYNIDVYDSRLPVYQQWRDERGFEDAHRGDGTGPLAPHERRLVRLGDQQHRLVHPSIHVVAAEFQDGTFEGTAAEYDLIVQRRTNAAADADYWIGVIDEAIRKPPNQIAEFVNDKIARRVLADAAARHSTALGDVAWVLRESVHQPQTFAATVEPERARLVKLRDELRRSVR